VLVERQTLQITASYVNWVVTHNEAQLSERLGGTDNERSVEMFR